MDSLHTYIIDNNLGDYSSIVALFITIIGFIFIIIKILQSKKVAEQAKEISENIRTDILRTDTVMEFTNALSAMAEIKRLHRKDAWEILPDRYSSLRKTLITIKSSFKGFTSKQIKDLQSAIQNFKNMEDQVETALIQKKAPENVDRLNNIISLQIDKVQEILIDIKIKIGIQDGTE